VRFLAMEYVPGEDLAQRIARGPLPVDEALEVARRIAEAMEAAHDQGIVHRDLKPANVKLMPDGGVKVLDFGLAKALDPLASAGAAPSDPTRSPTVTSLGTLVGVVLGTAAYMSPEQAKGKPVDRRTDIWAFGCILHEMLTGRFLFQGETISEVLAAVIMAPIALDDLPPSLAPRVRHLVRRCLERDTRRRLRDIGEARLLLEEVLSGAPEPPGAQTVAPAPATPPRARWLFPAAIVAVAVLAALATVGASRFLSPAVAKPELRRFEIAAHGPFKSGSGSRLISISPDGRTIAYGEAGKLFVRPLSRIEPTAIATAGEPQVLFWSPDSAHLGYVAGGKLWKVPGAGGESTLISDVRHQMTGGSSATWCPDAKIVLGTGDGPLLRVPSHGGDLEEYIPLEQGKENDIHDASCLPDGSLLFVPHLTGGRPSVLAIFADGRRKDLFKLPPDQTLAFPVYSRDGHILFRRQPANAGVWALPFSLSRHEVTGEPFMVAPEGDAPSVSDDGTLVHVRSGGSRVTQLAWTDRTGRVLGPIGAAQEQWPFPELSPDGKRLAIAAKENDVNDVWIHDVERGTRTRLDVTRVDYSIEAWSPDGRAIVLNEGTSAPLKTSFKNADGSGEARELGTGWAASYSTDGRYLVYSDYDPKTAWDLWYRDLKGDGKPVLFLKEGAEQVWPRLSPDGRFIAYASDESGKDEVYVKRFPGGEGKWQVSSGGGMWPRWSRRGDRLYYVREDTLVEVDVATENELRLGAPRDLFKRKPLGWSLIFGWPAGFDVSADGQRFVVAEPVSSKADLGGIVLVENWYREFAK
jgi:eukaryotic-like serine/threonine-protein kinase